MKKFLAVALGLSVLWFSCVKSADSSPALSTCTPISAGVEASLIQAFLAKDSLHFTADTSGVYYHIVDSGIGTAATASSVVSFTYSAWLTDGTSVAYATTPISYQLSNTIPGLARMAPYLKKRTHILLVIPPSLAYGCNGLSNGSTVIVPSNSVLYYDLTVTSVQ